ncbi:ParA family protein [Subtercola frigoramans]|uniref:Cellulose biosynthesis protein BcsQ n=1 Tax=Subtercola frigoramans TaxID=120298 RepID=A0ABS2L7X8_9MICO|nr:ParA family protein [Subtercola frigoramans]MBM7473089.1 cellulose biosynthesis protein BcsQ [Subtercola frigoramans]
MKIVAVYSTKGGVGKTTAAVNLAWAASEDFRVLLWDLDPQGAATFLLEVKPKLKGGVDGLVGGKVAAKSAIKASAFERLDVLPADASYRDLDLVLDHAKGSTSRLSRILQTVASDYDVVILDCPPGASLVASNAVNAADLVVVPVVPSPLSLRSLEQVTDFVSGSASSAPVLGFLSMVDRRKTLHREAVRDLPRDRGVVVNVVVPSSVVIERMGTERSPVGVYAPRTESANAFSELWVRVQSNVKATNKSKPRKRKR